MAEAEDDLRDVFRLLYADEDAADWAFSDDEETKSTGVVVTPRAKVDDVEEDVIESISRRYTKKRFFDALDSLLAPPVGKKQRIFPPARSLALATSKSSIPSTAPLPPLPPSTVYAPFSPLPLLARLRTFAAFSFPDLETPVDPVSLARGGWTSVSRTRVQCPACGREVDFGNMMDIKDARVRMEVGKRLGNAMKGNHAPQCPWRIKSCPDDLMAQLRRTVHPPISSSLVPLTERLQRDCLSEITVRWTSPLSDTQVENLQSLLRRHSGGTTTPNVSPLSAAMALFAWYPYHPNGTSSHVDQTTLSPRTRIVHCRVCQRRVGLWSFTPSSSDASDGKGIRQFDLVKEHLGWCPITEGTWWETTPLVGIPKEPSGEVDKGWVSLSHSLERKRWRR